MPIRLDKKTKENFRVDLMRAIKLQVQLFDALGTIEAGTGILSNLDAIVQEEAGAFDKVEEVKFTERDINAILYRLERDGKPCNHRNTHRSKIG